MTNEEAKDYIREWCPYDRQEEIIKALEQEPCEDAVSREVVLSLRQVFHDNAGYETEYVDIEDIKALPSVTPKPRTGKWEKAITPGRYRCSVCKGEHNDSEKGKWYEIFDTCTYNFCPNCGAKMGVVSK